MKEFLRKWKRHFVFAAFISLFINFLGLTFTFYMYTIYDVIVTSYSIDSLTAITILALYALGMLFLFDFVRHKILARAGLDLDATLSGPMLHKTLTLLSGPLKNVYARGIQDVRTLRDFFSTQGIFALFDAPWCPFYLILVFYMHRMLGLISVVLAVVIVLLTLLQERLCQKLILDANRINFENSRFQNTLFANADVLLAMGMGRGAAARWHERDRDVLDKQTTASNRAGLIQAVFKALQLLTQIAIYGVGAYYVIRHEITPGLMILASILQGQATRPIILFMHFYKTNAAAWEAYQRLSGFLNTWERLQPKRERLAPTRPRGALEARNVFFVREGRLILADVSCRLEPGGFLGVIGPSGAGKTTLAKLLCGLWTPVLGSVQLDEYNMAFWDKEALARHVGYLPQDIDLFPGTLAQNIAHFGPPDEARLEEVLRITGLSDLAASLPDGIHSPVGLEGGVVLSGGQKQRVAFARAIYHDPVLLVLDEPNSNLDEEGEAALIRCLESIRKTRRTTCVLISHTPGLLSVVDHILVLQNGRAADFGPRQEVLNRLMRSASAAGARQAGPAQVGSSV
ncbi:MAG: type I secretion system permease/ATPase [Desulfacinum sp.]|nr:type I secretion system permease/ATPase [Desulfacinum sp.]